jgi:hypothetical protein
LYFAPNFATIAWRFSSSARVFSPRALPLGEGAHRKTERFAEDQTHVRQRRDRVLQQPIVVFLVFLGGYAGQIVNANEDAEHVGLKIQCVGFPSLLKMSDRISADAAVQKGQVALGKLAAILGANDELIPMAEKMIGIVAATAMRDGIALEKNSGVLLEYRNVIGAVAPVDAAPPAIAVSNNATDETAI